MRTVMGDKRRETTDDKEKHGSKRMKEVLQ